MLFCLMLRREQPEEMLIVADRQGRIKHASASLAKILDTTPESLQVRSWLMVQRGGEVMSSSDNVCW